MTRRRPHSDSRIGRALELLDGCGDISPDELNRLLNSLCDTKQQRVLLRSELMKRGFIEHVIRLSEKFHSLQAWGQS